MQTPQIRLYNVLRQMLGLTEADAEQAVAIVMEASQPGNRELGTKEDVRLLATKEELKDLVTKDELKSIATKDNVISLQKYMLTTFIVLVVMILGLYATLIFGLFAKK